MKFRALQFGEIIQQGDEFDACADGWRDDPVWKPAPPHMIGRLASDPQFPAHTAYRRPVPLAAPLPAWAKEGRNERAPLHR